MAVEHRYMHEYGDTSPHAPALADLSQSVSEDQHLEVNDDDAKPAETTVMKNKFDAALAKAHSAPHRPDSSLSNRSNNCKNMFNASVSAANQQTLKQDTSQASVMKNKFDAAIGKTTNGRMEETVPDADAVAKDMFEAALARVSHDNVKEPVPWHSKIASSVKASIVGARLKEQGPNGW